jgi:hypothetical protein
MGHGDQCETHEEAGIRGAVALGHYSEKQLRKILGMRICDTRGGGSRGRGGGVGGRERHPDMGEG